MWKQLGNCGQAQKTIREKRSHKGGMEGRRVRRLERIIVTLEETGHNLQKMWQGRDFKDQRGTWRLTVKAVFLRHRY